jgi:hypothetical protein
MDAGASSKNIWDAAPDVASIRIKPRTAQGKELTEYLSNDSEFGIHTVHRAQCAMFCSAGVPPAFLQCV